MGSATGQPTCKIKRSQTRPLIVEWAQTDRADLEYASTQGLVAVRYTGCEMQLLSQCRIAGQYSFARVSPMSEEIHIRNEDELWANLPVGAAALEAKLADGGELHVAMTIAGKMSTELQSVHVDQLIGDCKAATHYISGLTVGAFELSTSARTEAGASASVLGVGAGATTRTRNDVLTTSGDRNACREEDPSSLSPNAKCRAVIRVEISEIQPARPPRPKTCPENMAFLPERHIPESWADGNWARLLKEVHGTDCVKTPRAPGCYDPAKHYPAFCIDKNSVTSAEYDACVASGKCNSQHLNCSPQATFRAPGRELHPINCVDFYQAETYCKAFGKRLPQPDEWEWAQGSARPNGKGALTPPWGARYPEKNEIWTSAHGEARESTLPVGSTPLSDTMQGVRDLFGNVSHWSDRYIDSSGGVQAALLGYSYVTTKETPIGTGGHQVAKPGAYGANVGFRCAMVAQ